MASRAARILKRMFLVTVDPFLLFEYPSNDLLIYFPLLPDTPTSGRLSMHAFACMIVVIRARIQASETRAGLQNVVGVRENGLQSRIK